VSDELNTENVQPGSQFELHGEKFEFVKLVEDGEVVEGVTVRNPHRYKWWAKRVNADEPPIIVCLSP